MIDSRSGKSGDGNGMAVGFKAYGRNNQVVFAWRSINGNGIGACYRCRSAGSVIKRNGCRRHRFTVGGGYFT